MSQFHKQKIGFIGGGNMAQALIGGMLAKGIKPTQIMVSDPSDSVQETLQAKRIKTTQDGLAVIEYADVVILAVKPQLFTTVLPALSGAFRHELVISVAAGVSTTSIAQLLNYHNIVRAMPNTPALVQTGATGLYATAQVSDSARALATEVMAAAGMVMWVEDEALMHAVTATSGSGPAYFFYFMEAMMTGAKAQGLDHKQARALVLQTALGAAQMAITSDDEPAVLRQKVTSPNGTTQAALESMHAAGIDQAIISGMQAAASRSETLATEMAARIADSSE